MSNNLMEKLNNISMNRFLTEFKNQYNFLYNNGDSNVCGYYDALNEWNIFIKNDYAKEFVGRYIQYTSDFISSDREVVAFMFALNTLMYEDENMVKTI